MCPRLGYRISENCRVTLVAILSAWGAVVTLWACQVPVFRYALERWEADAYTVVFRPGISGELSASEQKAFDYLSRMSTSEDFPANLQVKLAENGGDRPVTEHAMMDLIYPQKVRGLIQSPIWSGAATLDMARKIIDSPARRDAVEQILAGKSAVWLVVKSGDEKQDATAIAAMERVAAEASEMLKIPEGVIQQSDLESAEAPTGVPIDPENVLQSRVPLKIDFDVISIFRDDPAEAVFLQMLLNLEDDLGEFSGEPMVFPLFGRGRVLEPLIGRGVTQENALDYAGYLCGACSCEVKDQNPGMDLLVAANWEAALEGSQIIIEKILPPLEGLTGLVESGVASPVSIGRSTEQGIPSNDLEPVSESAEFNAATIGDVALVSFSWWWLATGGVFVVLIIGSLVILRKKTV